MLFVALSIEAQPLSTADRLCHDVAEKRSW